jgi:hypothetical protein
VGHGSAVRVRVTVRAAATARALNLCHSTRRVGRLRVALHIACYAIFAIKPSIVAKRRQRIRAQARVGLTHAAPGALSSPAAGDGWLQKHC